MAFTVQVMLLRNIKYNNKKEPTIYEAGPLKGG